MKLPVEILEQFRSHGREGGLARAARMKPEARTAVARRAAAMRWIGVRFGNTSFEALGIPGGDLVDAGLRDLGQGKKTIATCLVSMAAARLSREGIPLGSLEEDPEEQLYRMLEKSEGAMAHARYRAYRLRMVSFVNACSAARIDGN